MAICVIYGFLLICWCTIIYVLYNSSAPINLHDDHNYKSCRPPLYLKCVLYRLLFSLTVIIRIKKTTFVTENFMSPFSFTCFLKPELYKTSW